MRAGEDGRKEDGGSRCAAAMEADAAGNCCADAAQKMPVERASVTHKFSVGGHEAT